jgi:exonuclease SbcD
MRALIINDPHLADRPPSMRVEGYADHILAKLQFTTTIDSDIVIFSGDVWNLKAPTRTSHALVQRMCDIIRAYNRPVYIVVGNHDMQHDRLESLDKQPLGVLFKAGAIMLDAAVQTPAGPVFGVPWLSDWRRELPLYMKPWKHSKATLMVAHAPLVPAGENRPYEVIDAHDWAALMERPGHVAYGHMHDPEGVFHVNKSLFVNEGALARGTLNEASLMRKPAVTLYDSEPEEPGVIFRRIEVPHLPAEKVFRVAEKSADTEREDRLEAFLDSIGRTTLEAVSVESVISDLRNRGLRPEVLEEVQDIFETTAPQ